eukprot:3401414-Prymnesium_polylepis.1
MAACASSWSWAAASAARCSCSRSSLSAWCSGGAASRPGRTRRRPPHPCRASWSASRCRRREARRRARCGCD